MLSEERLARAKGNSFNGDHVYIQQLIEHIQAQDKENKRLQAEIERLSPCELCGTVSHAEECPYNKVRKTAPPDR